MALIIGRVIYSYLYRSFYEIDKFSRTLNTDKKNVFMVGSLDKEIVDLGNNFSKLSEKLYSLKKNQINQKKNRRKRWQNWKSFLTLP